MKDPRGNYPSPETMHGAEITPPPTGWTEPDHYSAPAAMRELRLAREASEMCMVRGVPVTPQEMALFDTNPIQGIAAYCRRTGATLKAGKDVCDACRADASPPTAEGPAPGEAPETTARMDLEDVIRWAGELAAIYMEAGESAAVAHTVMLKMRRVAITFDSLVDQCDALRMCVAQLEAQLAMSASRSG